MRSARGCRIVFDFRITLLHRNRYFIALHNIFFRRVLGGFRQLLILRRGGDVFCGSGLDRRPIALGYLGFCWRFSHGRGDGLLLVRDLRTVPEHVRNHLPDVIRGGIQRAKTRQVRSGGEVVLIFSDLNEVADRRIGGPRAAKRRTGQISRHALLQEQPDVGFRCDRFERRQRRNVECRFFVFAPPFRSLFGRRIGRGRRRGRRVLRRCCARPPPARPRACAATSGSESSPAHSSIVLAGAGRRPSASVLGRSRLRL